MILAGTGHRTLFGQHYPSKVWHSICERTIEVLEAEKPQLIISGGALGFDSLLMDAAKALEIPYVLAAPFREQDAIWEEKIRQKYRNYCSSAERVDIVSEGEYAPHKMQKRNEYMIDHSDVLLALLDPEISRSGTRNCFDYAKRLGKRIIHLNPREKQ